MKKNMKSVMSFTSKALTVILTVNAFTACQDDNDLTSQNNAATSESNSNQTSELKLNAEVYPLIYWTYLSDRDVQITSNDTTTMSISASLLKSQKVDLKTGNVISVWRAKNELPFMREITGITTDGNTVNVTTKDIQASDIIENADIEFDSKVYVNPMVSATNSDGSVNEDHYISKQDGVYHPVAIIVHSKERDMQMEESCKDDTNADAANSNNMYAVSEPYATNSNAVFTNDQSKEDDIAYLTDELASSNIDLGADIKGTVENITFPIIINNESKKDTIAHFGIEKATAEIKAGIHTTLNISWFKVKKFEIGPYYSITADVKPNMKASANLINWKADYTIAKCPGSTSVFWVGAIPVTISFKPSICLGLEAKGTIAGSIGLNYSAKGSGHTYAVYQNGKWRVDKGGDPFKQTVAPVFAGSLSASAKAGIYLKSDVMLYGVAGPTLAAGPYIKADAEAALDLAKEDVTAKASLKFGVDATVGAKLKVWKWSLAKWSTTVPLYENEIWKKSWSMKEWIKNSEYVANLIGDKQNDYTRIIASK